VAAVTGFTDRTAPLVDLCSHSLAIGGSAERWIAMMARLSHENSIEAWRIKLADLTDNLTQSQGLSPDNRRFMVETKAPLMLRLTEKHSIWIQPYRVALETEMGRQRRQMEAKR